MRYQQILLIVSTLLGSWMAMQGIHELGHVLGAWATSGEVQRVVLHPFTISRTVLGNNPQPLIVVWSGPLVGVLLPIAMWLAGIGLGWKGTFVLRFFAGFCLIANGAYLGGGSFDRVGDCGEMLHHGTPIWVLWLFGLICVPAGLALWHRLGSHFGLDPSQGKVDRNVTFVVFALTFVVVLVTIMWGGE